MVMALGGHSQGLEKQQTAYPCLHLFGHRIGGHCLELIQRVDAFTHGTLGILKGFSNLGTATTSHWALWSLPLIECHNTHLWNAFSRPRTGSRITALVSSTHVTRNEIQVKTLTSCDCVGTELLRGSWRHRGAGHLVESCSGWGRLSPSSCITLFLTKPEVAPGTI